MCVRHIPAFAVLSLILLATAGCDEGTSATSAPPTPAGGAAPGSATAAAPAPASGDPAAPATAPASGDPAAPATAPVSGQPAAPAPATPAPAVLAATAPDAAPPATPAATSPAPAAPPPAAAATDGAALTAALDDIDRQIGVCKTLVGKKAIHGCADSLAAMIKKLATPIASSPRARELHSVHHALKKHAAELVTAAKPQATPEAPEADAPKDHHKEQHALLDELAALSKKMRAKL